MSLRLVEFETIKPKKVVVVVDGEEKDKIAQYKPRGLKWLG